VGPILAGHHHNIHNPLLSGLTVWNPSHDMLSLMIRTVAIEGYRSLRDLLLPLGQLSVITLSLTTLARRRST
jgi:hypothetical protein